MCSVSELKPARTFHLVAPEEMLHSWDAATPEQMSSSPFQHVQLPRFISLPHTHTHTHKHQIPSHYFNTHRQIKINLSTMGCIPNTKGSMVKDALLHHVRDLDVTSSIWETPCTGGEMLIRRNTSLILPDCIELTYQTLVKWKDVLMGHIPCGTDTPPERDNHVESPSFFFWF